MREVLSPIEPVSIDTPLGRINVRPTSVRSVQVTAPNLTVDGVPLTAWSFMTGNPEARRYDPIMQYETRNGTWSTSPEGFGARLVDGRNADLVLLGKIAAVVIPAVNQLAQSHWGLFLEAQRRNLNNDIAGLEQELEKLRCRIGAKEQEFEAVERELHKLLG